MIPGIKFAEIIVDLSFTPFKYFDELMPRNIMTITKTKLKNKFTFTRF